MVTMGYDLPPLRLSGWSAADWSRQATNKFISSNRKIKIIGFCWERKSWTSWLLTCCSKKGWTAEYKKKQKQKGVTRMTYSPRLWLMAKTKRITESSPNEPDGVGKIKELAPRSEHVHLHQDIGHIREIHLQATLLPQLSKYAHASGIYWHCA